MPGFGGPGQREQPRGSVVPQGAEPDAPLRLGQGLGVRRKGAGGWPGRTRTPRPTPVCRTGSRDTQAAPGQIRPTGPALAARGLEVQAGGHGRRTDSATPGRSGRKSGSRGGTRVPFAAQPQSPSPTCWRRGGRLGRPPSVSRLGKNEDLTCPVEENTATGAPAAAGRARETPEPGPPLPLTCPRRP